MTIIHQNKLQLSFCWIREVGSPLCGDTIGMSDNLRLGISTLTYPENSGKHSERYHVLDTQTLASIDLGSNSFHLLIVRELNGELSVVDKLRERVRLAAGLNAEKS